MDNTKPKPKLPKDLWVKFTPDGSAVERMWVFEPFPPDMLRAENVVHYTAADGFLNL